MKRNTLYIVFLLIVLILVCLYVSPSITTTENFLNLSAIRNKLLGKSDNTLTSRYKRKDGVSNTPCSVIRLGISMEDLEKWFIGKTKTVKNDNGNNTETTETVDELPMMVEFFNLLTRLQSRCKFKKIVSYLDNVTENKDNVQKLVDISKDVKSILDKIVKNRDKIEQKNGIIDKLIIKYNRRKYNEPETIEAFTAYLAVEDITDEEKPDSQSCQLLEEKILEKYLTTDNLKYTYSTINGLERLLCECHVENKKIGKDLDKLFKKKHIRRDGSVNYKGIRTDLEKLRITIIQIKELLTPFHDYVKSKALELGFIDII